MLGQDFAELAGPVGDGALAELSVRDRKMGNGHRETARRCAAHHIYDASPPAVILPHARRTSSRQKRMSRDVVRYAGTVT
jgi:hypothetical protein